MKYETLFFDADDTLFDYQKAEAFALDNAFRDAGVPLDNGIKEVQHSRISRSPIAHCFAAVVVSEDAGCQKPNVGIFDYAFDRIGCSVPHPALMIGDPLSSDIQGGINAGMDTCWFNPRGTLNPTRLKPTYEIRSLPELRTIV